MAKKITELTELTTTAEDDLIIIEDVSTSTTKKITKVNFMKSITTDSLTLTAPRDAWVPAGETLTYASATTFTCSAGLAAVLNKGTRIKLTQTTVKYFTVIGVSGTTVTVTGGSDYTLANAAITAPYYSHEANPVGYPQYFAYTPALTNITIGNGTLSGRFRITGNSIHFSTNLVWGTTTSGGGAFRIGLPTTAANNGGYYTGTVIGADVGTTNRHGGLIIAPNTNYFEMISDGSSAGWATAVPFAWGNSDFIRASGLYEF